MARPRQANIPTDLTDIVEAKVDFAPLEQFVNQVKQTLRDNGIDDTQISIPNVKEMVKIEQKPELLREVLVDQGNKIQRLEQRNG